SNCSECARVGVMQSRVCRPNSRNLLRAAAVLLLASTAAGCSSQMTRFNGVDGIFTSSTNQREIIPPAAQPYPGDVAAAPVAASPSGQISRGTLAPATSSGAVTSSTLAPATV